MGMEAATQTSAVDSDRRRVLIVDDEPGFATLVAEYLETANGRLETVTATDPRKALDRIDGSFDCIVTDYQMPAMDGLTFLERADTDTDFVLFTQVCDDALAERVRDRGGTYVTKQSGAEQFADLAALVCEQIAE